MAKVALGKGLGALINTRVISPAPEQGERVQSISLAAIVPTPLQPRTEFRAEELANLVESVREHGIIQPLIARLREGRYELIAGERRWRAAKEVGLTEAPVIVREASDQEVLELALVENIQRADLNPIEEAMAYARLAREFGLKQDDIAQKVGKSRAAIANSMRLLELHADVQAFVAHNQLSVGHAKVLLGLKDQDLQKVLAEEVIRSSCTVRGTEKLVTAQLNGSGRGRRKSFDSAGNPDSDVAPKSTTEAAVEHLQNRLQQHLATHVALHHTDRKGKIEIEYYGLDDLQRILKQLGIHEEEA